MPEVQTLPSGRYSVRWRDALGRRHTPGFSFPTKSAARKYGEDRESEVRRGEHHDPKAGRVLLRDFATDWLAGYVAEPRTVTKVRSHIELTIKAGVGGAAPLGDLRLDAIDEMAVQAWVKRLTELARAPATIAGYHRTLSMILNAAVRAKRIRANPADRTTLPTRAPASDFYWEREEVDAIRAQLSRPLDRAVFELLLGTGMRWGEMAGLHADRWHPLRRQVGIVDALEEEHGFRLKAYPKGKKRRDVPVDEYVVEAVAAWLAETKPIVCGLKHPRGVRCSGLLFHDDGRPLSRHIWPREVLTPAIAAATVGEGKKAKPVRPGSAHALRHTYASWLIIDGVTARVVQDLLGHSSSRMTDRYAHLAPSNLSDPRLLAALAKSAPAVGRFVGQPESAVVEQVR